MDETIVVSAPVETAPPVELFPTATDEDKAPRIGKPPADPDAPYGWMVDSRTGERRPKRAPGRQPRPGKPATAPPRNRTANKPRTARPAPTIIDGEVTDTRSYPEKIADLVEAAWMVSAGIPPVDVRIMGVDVGAVATKAVAQGQLLREHKGVLSQVGGMAAQGNPSIARGVDWLSGSGGKGGWMLPAVMLLAPLAAQTVSLWRGTRESAQVLADRTRADFTEMVTALARQSGMMAAAVNVDQALADATAAR